MCDPDVYSREIINMFFVGQVSVPVENFKIGIFSDTVHAGDKYQTLRDSAAHWALPVHTTFTTFQGHSTVKQFLLKILCSYSNNK